MIKNDEQQIYTFTQLMKGKMNEATEKGRGGWQTCPIDVLIEGFRKCLGKSNEGNLVDLANFLMMLEGRGYKGSLVPDDKWLVGEGFPPNPMKVMAQLSSKRPGEIYNMAKWEECYFVGATQNGKHAIIESFEEGIHIVGFESIRPVVDSDKAIAPDISIGFKCDIDEDGEISNIEPIPDSAETVKLRDYQKTVHVDCDIKPEVKPEVLERELILEKWPHAQPLRDFVIEHDELLPGSLVVNHHKVDPMTVTEDMILNGGLLHWYNMQYWFVIQAPQWEEKEDEHIRQLCDDAAELLFAVTLQECREDVKGTIRAMINSGYRAPREELPKETELNIIFGDLGLRARDGGRTVASKLYELGYRSPKGGNDEC